MNGQLFYIASLLWFFSLSEQQHCAFDIDGVTFDLSALTHVAGYALYILKKEHCMLTSLTFNRNTDYVIIEGNKEMSRGSIYYRRNVHL